MIKDMETDVNSEYFENLFSGNDGSKNIGDSGFGKARGTNLQTSYSENWYLNQKLKEMNKREFIEFVKSNPDFGKNGHGFVNIELSI